MKTVRTTLMMLALMALASIAWAQPADNEYPPPSGSGEEQPDSTPSLGRATIKGRVERIDGERAYIRTEDGREVPVVLGPVSYWRSHGYRLRTGVNVTISGFCDGDNYDESPFFAAGIWGPGFYFELSNSDGFPNWCDTGDWYTGWYPTPDYYYRVYAFAPPLAYYRPHLWGRSGYWHRPFYNHRPHWRGDDHRWHDGDRRNGGDHRGGGGDHRSGGGDNRGGNGGGGGDHRGGGNGGNHDQGGGERGGRRGR